MIIKKKKTRAYNKNEICPLLFDNFIKILKKKHKA